MRYLLLLSLYFFLPASHATLVQGLPDFTALVEQEGAAVVNISTTKAAGKGLSSQLERHFGGVPEDSPLYDLFKHFFDEMPKEQQKDDSPRSQQPKPKSLGSGFIYSADGYIITNHHVVDGADEIIVRLTDRREFEAKLIGSDKRTDLALLKVEATGLPVVKLGSSDKLKVGAWVLAIGSPFGFEHSVTAGIVSAKKRSLPSGNSNYVPFIQTDVAINPGNSGGPLFNLNGEVVGVNAQIYSGSGGFMGLSFAIPVDLMKNVIKQIQDNGSVSRGWLGVMIQEVTRDLAESFGMEKPHGALVAELFDNGPAKEAGFQLGDVIVKFNGKEVGSSSELPPIVGSTPVGKAVIAEVLRDGKRVEIEVAVGELPTDAELRSSTGASNGSLHYDKLGLTITDMTDAAREASKIEEGGVLVKKVENNGVDAGIKVGDVIVMINRQQIDNPKAFASIVAELKPGQRVPVLINRKGSPTFLAIKVAE